MLKVLKCKNTNGQNNVWTALNWSRFLNVFGLYNSYSFSQMLLGNWQLSYVAV